MYVEPNDLNVLNSYFDLSFFFSLFCSFATFLHPVLFHPCLFKDVANSGGEVYFTPSPVEREVLHVPRRSDACLCSPEKRKK